MVDIFGIGKLLDFLFTILNFLFVVVPLVVGAALVVAAIVLIPLWFRLKKTPDHQGSRLKKAALTSVVMLSAFMLVIGAGLIVWARPDLYFFPSPQPPPVPRQHARDAVKEPTTLDPLPGWAYEGPIESGTAIRTSTEKKNYVEVPSFPVPRDFTLEVWVRPESFMKKAQMILDSGRPGVGSNQFRLVRRGRTIYFMMSGGSGGSNLWSPAGYPLRFSGIPLEAWTHIAVTKSGAEFEFLINGTSVARHKSKTVLVYSGNTPLRIGSGVGAGGTRPACLFSGAIDELRIWDIVHTAAEIQANMHRTIPEQHPEARHLVAYYQFDEGRGVVASDRTGKHPARWTMDPEWVESTAPIGR